MRTAVDVTIVIIMAVSCASSWSAGLWARRQRLLLAQERRRLMEVLPDYRGCDIPPAGWYCTREPGHGGPCAARQTGEEWT